MPGSAPNPSGRIPHSSHWGAFFGEWRDGRLAVTPHPADPDPNELLQNFPDALRHRARIGRPMVRRGWLERGPGPDERRGRDEYVALPWERALDLAGAELARVRDAHGPARIFGGSYGWASAGRFHHAQSQVHRFLNVAMGGYVRSVNSYSAGASAVILPHVIGPQLTLALHNVTWEQVAEASEVVLAFGGMALRNSAVSGGGISRHVERGAMRRAAERGCRFVLVGPLRGDLPAEARAEWVSVVPGTDTALMLGIAHTLAAEKLHDQAFLDRFCVGWERFSAYLSGAADGVRKDAEWAAAICGVSAEAIRALARSLPGRRVLVTVAHSLQRSEHGEQPVWMGVVLAAMLGQIGLPGGGYAYALGGIGYYGRRAVAVPLPTLEQGRNGVADFIPVARIADLLLNPGGRYDYDGAERRYADIRLLYWVGGNPFHHHQDLARLRRAFARPETIIVHETAWTATARHADIVFPCTMTLEREDIGAGSHDPLLVPMRPLAAPYGEARDDYAIFAGLARRLGREAAFTEGRDVRGWLAHLYEPTRAALGPDAPDFETFFASDGLDLPQRPDDGGIPRAFRADPDASPLPTPSGRVEIFSETVAGYGYDDCPGHPSWLAPSEPPSPAAPLWLIANQPATRLHSQLDFGGTSAAAKHRGREVVSLHPSDAAARGIAEGDIVRLHNARGACLAAARITEDVRRGVAQLPTGAWYDPEDPEAENPLCVHGNPNVLTRDIGTSRLAQGCTGQITTVEVSRFDGNLPPIRAYDPPVGREALAGSA